ncbi:MAG: site-specific DNA-methyltransferase [Chlorobi bacterium]|nr:site-specific DNA-methyltransferase [Chlorobiota bacterium]MCI0715941.1 site-specific DNA-methyltransferase [Chlorobiota bacterium]
MDLLTIKQASKWASSFLNKNVTESNIAYLINYGRVPKKGENGNVYVSKKDLEKYYSSYNGNKEIDWKSKLGDDLNWHLSFEQYKEAETTKHVHRLHPYKGKFIPQLVEYFLDSHTDEFKKEVYFNKGDIILDPFCGSGTALVQANELGIHAIGIDISEFNSLISNVKIKKYNITDVQMEIKRITNSLSKYLLDSHVIEFDDELANELYKFNTKYFPSPEYRYKVNNDLINEFKYSEEKVKIFLPVYERLVKQYRIKLKQSDKERFLDQWYLTPVRHEIEKVFEEVKKIKNPDTKKIITVILSRTIRSCRATTHSDLATLKEPVSSVYYCSKHNKICKPLFSIKKMWDRYSKDSASRLVQFNKLRTDTYQICLSDDSETIDIIEKLNKKNKILAMFVKKQKIAGIFSSPPYVGLIDYHEQHAYAYDLFGFKRRDELEIGPLSKGQSKEARNSYVESIAKVLNNCKKYFNEDYNVFLVANDKYNLYPAIAEKAGMKIVNQFKRPVLNRTEKDKGAYSEIIFHFKNK